MPILNSPHIVAILGDFSRRVKPRNSGTEQRHKQEDKNGLWHEARFHHQFPWSLCSITFTATSRPSLYIEGAIELFPCRPRLVERRSNESSRVPAASVIGGVDYTPCRLLPCRVWENFAKVDMRGSHFLRIEGHVSGNDGD